MSVAPKKKTVAGNGDTGIDAGLVTAVTNGEDLGPIVGHAFEPGKPEALLHQLRTIVKKKEVEIEKLCKLHYEEFILAVDELRGVLVDADELKSMLSSENFRLQEVASALLGKLEELLKLYSIKTNVTEALQTLKVCVEVSNLCLTCNRHIAEGRFYPALKTLGLIEEGILQTIPVKAFQTVIEKQIPSTLLHTTCWVFHCRGSGSTDGTGIWICRFHQHSPFLNPINPVPAPCALFFFVILWPNLLIGQARSSVLGFRLPTSREHRRD